METSVCCIRLLTHLFSWRFQSNLRYWQWDKFGDWWRGRGSRTNSIHCQWFSGSIQKPRRGRRAPQSRGACQYKAVVSRQSDDNWTTDGTIEERGNTTCCCLRQSLKEELDFIRMWRTFWSFYGSQLENKTCWDRRLTIFMVLKCSETLKYQIFVLFCSKSKTKKYFQTGCQIQKGRQRNFLLSPRLHWTSEQQRKSLSDQQQSLSPIIPETCAFQRHW